MFHHFKDRKTDQEKEQTSVFFSAFTSLSKPTDQFRALLKDSVPQHMLERKGIFLVTLGHGVQSLMTPRKL